MLNRNDARLIATFVVWAAFVAIMIWGRYPNVSEGNAVFLTGVLALAAAASTVGIWMAPAGSETEENVKAKRRSHVSRMLDRLDENQLTELRARLLETDEAAVSVSDLLAVTEQKQRRG